MARAACASPVGYVTLIYLLSPASWSYLSIYRCSRDILTDVLACRHANPERIGDDLRFAAAIYRAALDTGVMDDVVFN